MRSVSRLLVLTYGVWAWAAHAQPIVEASNLYRQTCSTCHDGGGGGAPRLGRPDEWQQRLNKGREALVQSALKGVPNSAMMAKGGYDLSDAQVMSLVDWMMSQVRASTILAVSPRVSSSAISQSQLNGRPALANSGLTAEQLALGLREKLGQPDQAIETVDSSIWLVRGLGIKISLQAGVAVLSGTVQESSTVEKAENWVRQQTGVTQVTNRLVAASVFEWD